MFDISDSSSRSQTQCLWHILALLYPHLLPRASKWDTSAESKNHRPSPQTERFVCGAVIGKQIDGENIKSIAFTWLLFKMLILAKQMLLISFFFSLSLFLFLCKKKCKKKKLWASAYSRQNTIIIHSTANTDCEPQSKKKRVTNVDLWKWTVHFSSDSSFIFQKWEGSGGRRRQGLQPLLHICCMATHVNSEFSFSFLWRHYGWNPPITWKCVSERCWNCSLWFFLPAVPGQLRSHPIHFIVLQPDISQEPPRVQNRLFMWLPSCDSSLAAGQTIDKVLWEVFVLTKIGS